MFSLMNNKYNTTQNRKELSFHKTLPECFHICEYFHNYEYTVVTSVY